MTVARCALASGLLAAVHGFVQPPMPLFCTALAQAADGPTSPQVRMEASAAPSPLEALQTGLQRASESDTSVTFLEGNSWYWKIKDVSMLVDPLIYALDFGIPSLIQGKKAVIDGEKVFGELAPQLDWVIISQGFDDHCQPATIEALSKQAPSLRYIAPPSAAGVIENYVPKSQVTYLLPGQSTTIGKKGQSQGSIKVLATTGDTLGPPWQTPENGYLLKWGTTSSKADPQLSSLYYEPHCKYNVEEFEKLGLQADIVVTPVIEQLILGAYPLVSGQKRAAELAKALGAKVVVPMQNGELDISDSVWLFQKLVTKGGTVESFKELLASTLPNAKVADAPPGVNVALA